MKTEPTQRLIYNHAITQWLNLGEWSNPMALTLTLKQSIQPDVGQHIRITEHAAAQNVRHLLNVLNRKLLRRSELRAGARIGAAFVSEQGEDKRLHYHGVIECPRQGMMAQLPALIGHLWAETTWGYQRTEVAPCDGGWISYILKGKDKPVFDEAIRFELWSLPLKSRLGCR